VSALVSLKIPKRESIALVRQSAGATADEITRNALRIRGQGWGQSPQLLNGHAPLPNTSAPATQVPVTVQKQSNVTAEAIAALVLLGIPEHNAAAQPRLKTALLWGRPFDHDIGLERFPGSPTPRPFPD
jgi:hypothetical protein